ncbi:hypothetical protein P280DRAFT_70119 [Massarina eburnea CBS 473.64]|uniref:Uncharacterized protein n=1 Tax=Massarina eburnea CBS 473.64 TaxID=1395130 RepID=A0A6A6RYJ9_9PLEO|nr:hypothetical protein P280DRAFT_70119 [Massarina eburnea CBS 473.64]
MGRSVIAEMVRLGQDWISAKLVSHRACYSNTSLTSTGMKIRQEFFLHPLIGKADHWHCKMLPASVFAPRPRRLVDRRGNWITVTRRSAPARITALPQEVSQVTSELVTSPEAANIPACSPRVTNVPPRDTVKTKRPQRRRVSVLDSTLSHSSEDDSDSDSCYITFIHSLRKKDVLRLESHLGVDDALDRTLSKRSMSPSPTLQTSPHSKTAVYRILKAQYSGNTVESGNLSAQLTVGPTKRPGQAESARPLFKWVHLENPEMNFGAYLVRF